MLKTFLLMSITPTGLFSEIWLFSWLFDKHFSINIYFNVSLGYSQDLSV